MSKRKHKIEPWQVRDKRKRTKWILPPRKQYLIYTEGKSEAIYFSHYKSSTGPIIIALNQSDQKVSLVKKAIQERDSRIQAGQFNTNLDEAWVILDRDADRLNKFDKVHFNRALDLAKKNALFIAYSNDAFELWFILHYQDLSVRTHREQLFRLLSRLRGIKKYKKTDDLYQEIKPFRQKAIQRAEKLYQSDQRPENANPSTTVHQLVIKLISEPGFREEE